MLEEEQQLSIYHEKCKNNLIEKSIIVKDLGKSSNLCLVCRKCIINGFALFAANKFIKNLANSSQIIQHPIGATVLAFCCLECAYLFYTPSPSVKQDIFHPTNGDNFECFTEQANKIWPPLPYIPRIELLTFLNHIKKQEKCTKCMPLFNKNMIQHIASFL